MFEHLEKKTALVKAARQELVAPAEISKYSIGAVIMWFGARDLVHYDLDRFNFELNLGRQFPIYASFEIPDAAKVRNEAYPAFLPVDLDLSRELERTKNPLSIFIITTAAVAEYPWLAQLPDGLLEFRRQQGRAHTTFIYKIILGSGFSQEGPRDPQNHFSQNEMRAHQLGGIYLPYSHDYPSVSARRVIEFMNRVLGLDLPGEKFPNYTMEEIMKIARNISGEDFNAYFPRKNAIPKYQIVNGKPQFPF